MPEETEMVEEPIGTEIPEEGVTPEVVDPQEFKKLQDALKAANKEAKERRLKLDAFEKAEEERKQAAMTEAERAAAKIKEYESKLALLERDALVRKVADEVGLPHALAERLQGATEEELKADAVKLLELVPPKTKQPIMSPTNPGNASKVESFAEMKERLTPSPVNVWDPQMTRQRGGGVITNDKE